MVKAISIKIIEIGKLKKNTLSFKQNFTEKEIKYCQSYQISYPHFAGKLSAKKAVMDILGLKAKKVDLREIEILNNSSGQPQIKLSGKVKEKAEKMKVKNLLISISHSENYAVANIIAI